MTEAVWGIMKRIISLGLCIMLAACGGSVPPPPRNLNDACAIKSERPRWHKDLLSVERRCGVPEHVLLATIYQESKFVGQARTHLSFALGVIPMGRDSSAYVYAQAIDSTWEWYLRETGNRRAKRDNFRDAVDFMGWYMNESNERLAISKADTRSQYLAYHDGHTGYARRTYQRKAWLLRISSEVAARAEMYQEQLKTCRR